MSSIPKFLITLIYASTVTDERLTCEWGGRAPCHCHALYKLLEVMDTSSITM